MLLEGGEDYEQLSSSRFSPQLNFTDVYRHRCFNVTIIDDDLSEQIESFNLQLMVDSSLASLSIDLLPGNATVHIVDDDGINLKSLTRRMLYSLDVIIFTLATIIGFKSDTYVALEAEGSVLICLQVLNQINSGHSHQANNSIKLIVLSTNRTASKTN